MDMDNQEHAILSIYNGHVTGRSIGGPASALALEAMRAGNKDRDLICFKTQLDNGHIVKTTTLSVSDHGRTFVIVINFDCTVLLQTQEILEGLTHIRLEDTHNIFYKSSNEMLNQMLDEAVRQIGRTPAEMTKAERIEAIRYLESRGGLLMQRSINDVAGVLGVTRCTIYNYLKEIHREKDKTEPEQP